MTQDAITCHIFFFAEATVSEMAFFFFVTIESVLRTAAGYRKKGGSRDDNLDIN